MNFFLTRDNERFRALENPSPVAGVTQQVASSSLARGQGCERCNEVMGYIN